MNSNTIGALAAAFAKAQGEFQTIPKDSEVEVKSKEGKFLYRYKYADLTTIISCTRPALSKNGISFTQGMVEGGFATTLMHESGETIVAGFVPFEVPRSVDMKQVAGLFTYVKRISLTAALGVSADEDVDAGAVESEQGNQTTKGKTASPPDKKAPSDAQLKRLFAISRQAGWAEMDVKKYMNMHFKIESTKDLSWVQYDDLCKHIERHPKKGVDEHGKGPGD